MQWLLTKPENAFIYNNCSLFNEAQIKLFGTCKKYGVIVIDKQACLTLSLSLSLSLSFSLSNTHFLSPFLFWMTDRSWSTYQLKVNAKKIYLIMHLCTTHVVLFQGPGNQVKNGLVIFKNKVPICTRKRFLLMYHLFAFYKSYQSINSTYISLKCPQYTIYAEKNCQ